MEISHFSHKKHPLKLNSLVVLIPGIVCSCCSQPITESSYCCFKCKFFLHKSCAELPLEITHGMHPQHTLELLFTSWPWWCNMCGKYIKGFTYWCSKCVFGLDVLCAQKVADIHFSHNHTLILKDLDDEVVSYGCEEPITRSTYCCDECKFFLHESCKELPLKITFPMHSQHPLELKVDPYFRSPNWSRSAMCNICRRKCSGFVYHCSECNYDVDIFCAQLEDMVNHPSHHHPLKFQPRSALFFCDACQTKEIDELYYYTVCPFWIHKTCGSRPIPYPFKGHPHPLSLAYSFPEEYKGYGLKCEICRKELNPSHWVYYCGPCRHFIHLSCMKSKEDEPIEVDPEIPPNVLNLPAEHVSSFLIQYFFKQRNVEGQIISKMKMIKQEDLPQIDHFSHDHPLVRYNIQDDYSEMTKDDQETMCNACVEPISGACYSCKNCKYFIHEHCTQLPNELSHFDHPEHKLSLRYCQEFFHFYKCGMCKHVTNGFFYECKECSFLLDIKCALLPTTIKHQAHKHLLVRGKDTWGLCNGCNRHHRDVDLACKHCDFGLAIECAMLPQVVRHRWDEHPLILSAPPFYYHPDIFICDICEEEIHPKFWLYHCRECDNSFHPKCILKHDWFPHVKFGGTIQIDYHPHLLAFVRKAKFKSSCDLCHESLSTTPVFECEACYFSICRKCILTIVDPNYEEPDEEKDLKTICSQM